MTERALEVFGIAVIVGLVLSNWQGYVTAITGFGGAYVNTVRGLQGAPLR